MKQGTKHRPDEAFNDEKAIAHRILKQLIISSSLSPPPTDSLAQTKKIVGAQCEDRSQENEKGSRFQASRGDPPAPQPPRPLQMVPTETISETSTSNAEHHAEPSTASTITRLSPLEGRATTPGAVSIVLRQVSSHSSAAQSRSSSSHEYGPPDTTTDVPVTAELVNQDYERQLEEEVRRLQEQVQQSTPRISVPLCIQALPIDDGSIRVPLGNEEEVRESSNSVNEQEDQDANTRRKTIRNMRLVLAAVAVVALLVAVLVVTSFGPKDDDNTRNDPAYSGSSRTEEGMDIIYSDPRFLKFRNALISSGVVSDPRWNIKNRRPMNILAPTNEAFERFFQSSTSTKHPVAWNTGKPC